MHILMINWLHGFAAVHHHQIMTAWHLYECALRHKFVKILD